MDVEDFNKSENSPYGGNPTLEEDTPTHYSAENSTNVYHEHSTDKLYRLKGTVWSPAEIHKRRISIILEVESKNYHAVPEASREDHKHLKKIAKWPQLVLIQIPEFKSHESDLVFDDFTSYERKRYDVNRLKYKDDSEFENECDRLVQEWESLALILSLLNIGDIVSITLRIPVYVSDYCEQDFENTTDFNFPVYRKWLIANRDVMKLQNNRISIMNENYKDNAENQKYEKGDTHNEQKNSLVELHRYQIFYNYMTSCEKNVVDNGDWSIHPRVISIATMKEIDEVEDRFLTDKTFRRQSSKGGDSLSLYRLQQEEIANPYHQWTHNCQVLFFKDIKGFLSIVEKLSVKRIKPSGDSVFYIQMITELNSDFDSCETKNLGSNNIIDILQFSSFWRCKKQIDDDSKPLFPLTKHHALIKCNRVGYITNLFTRQYMSDPNYIFDLHRFIVVVKSCFNIPHMCKRHDGMNLPCMRMNVDILCPGDYGYFDKRRPEMVVYYSEQKTFKGSNMPLFRCGDIVYLERVKYVGMYNNNPQIQVLLGLGFSTKQRTIMTVFRPDNLLKTSFRLVSTTNNKKIDFKKEKNKRGCYNMERVNSLIITPQSVPEIYEKFNEDEYDFELLDETLSPRNIKMHIENDVLVPNLIYYNPSQLFEFYNNEEDDTLNENDDTEKLYWLLSLMKYQRFQKEMPLAYLHPPQVYYPNRGEPSFSDCKIFDIRDQVNITRLLPYSNFARFYIKSHTSSYSLAERYQAMISYYFLHQFEDERHVRCTALKRKDKNIFTREEGGLDVVDKSDLLKIFSETDLHANVKDYRQNPVIDEENYLMNYENMPIPIIPILIKISEFPTTKEAFALFLGISENSEFVPIWPTDLINSWMGYLLFCATAKVNPGDVQLDHDSLAKYFFSIREPEHYLARLCHKIIGVISKSNSPELHKLPSGSILFSETPNNGAYHPEIAQKFGVIPEIADYTLNSDTNEYVFRGLKGDYVFSYLFDKNSQRLPTSISNESIKLRYVSLIPYLSENGSGKLIVSVTHEKMANKILDFTGGYEDRLVQAIKTTPIMSTRGFTLS